MDSALWWVMQQIHPLPEQRKIILVVTDGEPNNREAACEAIRTATAVGFEVYGIGIQTQSILNLLPEQRCRVIASINELAPAMFAVLGQSLLRHDTA
jgi:cobalamin biosynthesis protein CobT